MAFFSRHIYKALAWGKKIPFFHQPIFDWPVEVAYPLTNYPPVYFAAIPHLESDAGKWIYITGEALTEVNIGFKVLGPWRGNT